MRRMAVLATLVAVLAVTGPVAAQQPTTTTVVPTTTTAPAEAPAAETTLAVGDEASYRAALTALSADVTGPHTIDLTADITVDDGTDPTYTGTQPLTIDGHDFTLDAAGTSRLLVMDSATDAALTLTAVRLVNGSGAGDGGAVQAVSASPVTIVGSELVANRAAGSGGALAAAARVDITGSIFSENQAATGDGGAVALAGGEVTTLDSTFAFNRAPAGDGGAIGPGATPSDVGIGRTTFVGNVARRGGAVYVVDQAGFVNSTIVDNSASVSGGGVEYAPRTEGAMWFVTITGNQAPTAANLVRGERGRLDVIFSIVAEAVGGPGCAGRPSAQGSHVDDGTCGSAPEGSPELGPLTDNGGPTLTRLPLPDSPVIDAVPADVAPQVLGDDCAQSALTDDVDQRGEPRLVDGDHETRISSFHGPRPVPADCDQGAVEAAFVPLPTEPTGPVAASPGFTG